MKNYLHIKNGNKKKDIYLKMFGIEGLICICNRKEGKIGRCKATDKVRVALVSTHNFEEPCISGENGSGTVFFSNCNLNCIYCQNYEISQQGKGKDITIEELAKIFLIQHLPYYYKNIFSHNHSFNF